HFKSDFAPDTLLGINYICHLAVLRTSLVREVGGFTVGLEGVQDHDLFLRITEKTKNIYHIPKILYHWRMIEGSTSLSVDNKAYA
ncbi:glycosyltransferase family 2 protein, partial [Blautia faecis]|nr:glycosyltransferase family 2 protein [Blautia faecis]